MNPLLAVDDLRVDFGRHPIPSVDVAGLTFEVMDGEAVGLIGPSGAGKTTAALAIMGLHRPGVHVAGSVRLHGRELIHMDHAAMRPLRGRDIALVPQDSMAALHPLIRVRSQIAGSVVAHRPDLTKPAALEFADALLERVGITRAASRTAQYAFQWSGGMRQRALIAMAIAHRPALLIADEPTTALDVATQRQILELLRSLQDEHGMAILLITHDRGVMSSVADRVVQFPTSRAVPQPGTVATTSPVAARISSATATSLLTVTGLSVHYTSGRECVRAVNGIELDVGTGSTLAIVGESGCGKSTLARALVCLEPLASGAISINGETVMDATRSDVASVRRSIQLVFQDSSSALNPRRRIGETVAEPLRIHGLYDVQGGQRRVDALLDLVGLAPSFANRFPYQLSGGERQRVALARSLALDPRILVLDEPLTALDPASRIMLIDVLARLQRERAIAIILIAHDLHLVRDISDQTAVMRAGRFVETGDTASLFAHPNHAYTRELIASSVH